MLKFKTVPIDLSELYKVVNNIVYDKLVAKANNIELVDLQ